MASCLAGEHGADESDREELAAAAVGHHQECGCAQEYHPRDRIKENDQRTKYPGRSDEADGG